MIVDILNQLAIFNKWILSINYSNLFMNITLKQLRAFVAVAESRSFIEACSVVHLSQPALSAAIRNLEETVGGSLLARTTRSLSLTPEGEVFLPTAKQILSDCDSAFSDLHNLFSKQRGKLSIAAMPTFAANRLPDILVHFHQLYPNINIAIHDVIAEEAVEMVRAGRVEFAISFDPEEGEDLAFKSLFTDYFVAVMPRGHRLAQQRQLSWEDLQNDPVLLIQHPSSIRKQIDTVVEEHQIKLSVEIESHQLTTLGRMVANGLGISIIPSICTQQMEEVGAVCRPLGSPEISRDVGIITRNRYPMSSAAKAMITTLEEHM